MKRNFLFWKASYLGFLQAVYEKGLPACGHNYVVVPLPQCVKVADLDQVCESE